ncbi:MerR family transcriptional regulator [Bifidobacterium crudilactis]|jgi:DNA-binding transcriptional MerR regulator|uniref:MerR family transcriptional regulator n=1 Tax=Bifidobacterium crudilactis TaxID=327277 RepID=A0A971CYG6_9BIFI|nr:MerR family transcriptional regulator [Bifidobacterium crudilactis]MCI1867878.1 MerR family transcriptional regulator [Bifidobacterium crudilactis]MDN5972950.1 MerR family transcriptional regulator [Bifidobacterium crudilactis]MDN6001317.1 MerR family transcriptional regulator [Bifidobacterium crudilactis]MDN6209230.1 MerR family transcriptional regulator [Bifidobacterium crudilactis]MDN6458648.1 MerR family transcriptional regulator [Bifidobacterium crudilactis]
MTADGRDGHKDGETTLRLHVPLEQRDDLSADDAIQGELFGFPQDDSDIRGYRGTVASKVAGITYRQLDYWARKQIVEPSINPSHGSGSRRLYSFKDIVILAVSKKLLDAGVNLQNVTTAIGYLLQRDAQHLEDVTIMCDGSDVRECTDVEQLSEMMNSGKAVFAVSVSSLWHQMEEQLEHEDFVEIRPSSRRKPAGRPIDELTEMRMRRRLEAQRSERERA